MLAKQTSPSNLKRKDEEAATNAINKRIKTSDPGDYEWTSCWKPHIRKRAIIRGLDLIFSMAQRSENFDRFGNDIIQCFYDVATVTGEPVRSRALMYVEQLAHRWKHSVMLNGWKENSKPKPLEIIETIIGMYCMERVGIHHDVKDEVLMFIGNQELTGYRAIDYLGWDPENQPPPNEMKDLYSGLTITRYRSMSDALIHTFYAHRVGLKLGCSYADVFKWLHIFHPYKSSHELPMQSFIDQCYLVTHVIFTLNNWGELRLIPELLPHEFCFVKQNLMMHIERNDIHLVGEFIEVLRAFGVNDSDTLIQELHFC